MCVCLGSHCREPRLNLNFHSSSINLINPYLQVLKNDPFPFHRSQFHFPRLTMLLISSYPLVSSISHLMQFKITPYVQLSFDIHNVSVLLILPLKMKLKVLLKLFKLFR